MLRASIQRWVLIAGLGAGVAGCSPSGDRAADEEKDPYFQTGMSRKQALDYGGAVEAFEQALRNNPHSSAAHFELGLICYQHMTNWARAIYHLEQSCRLKPDSNKADAARQFIAACKQELVREVPLGLVSQQLQKEFARLTQENKDLRQQVEQLHQQLALQPQLTPSPTPPPPSDSASPTPAPPEGPRPAPEARTYTVRAGDTAYSIARRYGVRPGTLLAANPGVEARRLKIGQVLVVPNP